MGTDKPPVGGKDKPFIAVTGLRKSFGGVPAVRGVGFEVPLGATVSLLGPSGCGKTTMLRSIAGLETPNSGRISIGDSIVFCSERKIDVAPEKREIGMVFQSYAVWPHMTVGENVGFPLKVKRVAGRERDARVREALALVGLEGFEARPATNLSGGQQQRVALARAIVHEPRLVLFDEPLSNLDAKLRHQMRTELRLLQNRLGFTAIYVTHDQQEALALSDTVIVMNAGTVEAMASPRELFTNPSTPFVANFLGFDNMYEGKVCGVEESASLVGRGRAAAGRAIRVAVGEFELGCRWQGEAPPDLGAAVMLGFRGETVAIHARDAGGAPAAPDENRLTGTVESCVYLGTHQDYIIAAGALRVRGVGPGDSPIGRGDAVSINIRAQDCIAFPRGSSGMVAERAGARPATAREGE